jgi:hypothetical protein
MLNLATCPQSQVTEAGGDGMRSVPATLVPLVLNQYHKRLKIVSSVLTEYGKQRLVTSESNRGPSRT